MREIASDRRAQSDQLGEVVHVVGLGRVERHDGEVAEVDVTLANGTRITNEGTLSLNTLGVNPDIHTGSGGGGSVVNAGTLVKGGTTTGTAGIHVAFSNTGTVAVEIGTLAFFGSAARSIGGDVQIAPGTIFDVTAGSATFEPTSSLTGAGMLRSSGVVTLDDAMSCTIQRLHANDGTITVQPDLTLVALTHTGTTANVGGPGDLTITGSYSTNGGTHQGPGTTTFAPGATGTFSGTLSDRDVLIRDGASATVASANVTLANGARITNEGTLSLNTFGVNPDILTGSGGGGSVLNAGTLVKGGTTTGTGGIHVAFSNTGTVAVEIGTLNISGTFTNYDAATDVLSGGAYELKALLQFAGADVRTLNAMVALDGAGASLRDSSNADGLRNLSAIAGGGGLALGNGKTLTRGAGITSAGALTIGSGSRLTAPTVTLTGGTLAGSGTVTANVDNQGAAVRPGSSPGTLTIEGTYSQGEAARLDLDVAGTAAGTHDVLAVTGSATLAGSLSIATDAAFAPADADAFRVLTAGSVTGAFTTATTAGTPGGVYEVSYAPAEVVATFRTT